MESTIHKHFTLIVIALRSVLNVPWRWLEEVEALYELTFRHVVTVQSEIVVTRRLHLLIIYGLPISCRRLPLILALTLKIVQLQLHVLSMFPVCFCKGFSFSNITGFKFFNMFLKNGGIGVFVFLVCVCLSRMFTKGAGGNELWFGIGNVDFLDFFFFFFLYSFSGTGYLTPWGATGSIQIN